MSNETELKSLLDSASKSPLIQQIRAEEAKKLLKVRLTASKKINVLEEKRTDIVSELQKVLAQKQSEYQTAKALLESKTDELRVAHAALSNEDNRFDREINKQKDILIESADPSIDEAILFYRDKLDWLRKPGCISNSTQESQLNPITMVKNYTVRTNRNAVLEAMAYAQQAIELLQKMKLLPSLPPKTLPAMKANIPDIENFIEVSSQNQPGQEVSIRAARRLNEENMNHNLAMLYEKVDKHLSNRA